MRNWLFPDKRKFYEGFSGLAHRLTAIAVLLVEGFATPARFPELLGEIHRLDQEADRAAHALDAETERQIIPPMDREGIHLLSTRLARVADIIGGPRGQPAGRRTARVRGRARPHPGAGDAGARWSGGSLAGRGSGARALP